MVVGIDRKIEIIGILINLGSFTTSVLLIPYITNILASFISFSYVPTILSFVIAYILSIRVWPLVFAKIFRGFI